MKYESTDKTFDPFHFFSFVAFLLLIMRCFFLPFSSLSIHIPKIIAALSTTGAQLLKDDNLDGSRLETSPDEWKFNAALYPTSEQFLPGEVTSCPTTPSSDAASLFIPNCRTSYTLCCTRLPLNLDVITQGDPVVFGCTPRTLSISNS